jgi:hypothetical protein
VFQEEMQGAELPDPHSIHRVSTPANHDVDPEKQLVTVKFGKNLTVKDIERYAATLRANPLFRPNFSEIVDLTHVETLDLQADEFLRLADEIDPFSTEAKRAFVAGTSVQNHAARMHKILRTQRNIEIFRTVAEAKRWIMK